MSQYVVLFPADNEAEWDAGTDDDHQRTYDIDLEFGRLLSERGGAVTGGAGLGSSSAARTIRRGPASDVLVKPFENIELKAAIDHACEPAPPSMV